MKQHKNGDVSFWFSSDLCVAIKFAGYDTVDYFVRLFVNDYETH